MSTGVILIIALLVMRLNAPSATVSFPDNIQVPKGVTVTAFTKGNGWYALVTKNQRILFFDTASGAIQQTIAINP